MRRHTALLSRAAFACLGLAVLAGCASDPESRPATAPDEPTGNEPAPPRWREARPDPLPERPPLYDEHTIPDSEPAEDEAQDASGTEPPDAAARYPGDTIRIRRLHLKDAKIVNALRLIAELTGVNAVATREAAEEKVTLYLQNVSTLEAVRTLCRLSGLWFRRDETSGAFRVMTGAQYRRDLVVLRNDRTRVMKLRFPNALTAATAIEDLYGDRVELSLGIDGDELLFSSSGTGGGGFSNGGFDTERGGNAFSRSGQDASRFGRSTSNSTSSSRGSTAGSERGENERTVKLREDITAEQIARLADRLEAKTDTEDLLDALSEGEPPIYVTVNREHNLIIVRSTDEEAMGDISRLVAEIDRPTPQVLLEMKILELDIGDTFRSIFDLTHTAGSTTTGPEDGQPGNPLSGAAEAAQNVLGSGNFALEGGSFVYQFLDENIRARIQLLQRDNRLNVVATPMVLASNNRPARVFVGEQRVLVTGASTDVIVPEGGATTTLVEPITEVRDIGNTINILPKINADRSVTLMVNQDTSSVVLGNATIPIATASGGIDEFAVDSVRTSQLQGVVVARHGLTVAIGGLIRSEMRDLEEKVPVLGDLPLIGTAFRKEIRERTRSELVLLITPHVIKTPGEGDRLTRERIEALSEHPYRDRGDRTHQAHFKGLEKRLKRDAPFDRRAK